MDEQATVLLPWVICEGWHSSLAILVTLSKVASHFCDPQDFGSRLNIVAEGGNSDISVLQVRPGVIKESRKTRHRKRYNPLAMYHSSYWSHC